MPKKSLAKKAPVVSAEAQNVKPNRFIATMVADLKRQFINDGVHHSTTFSAEFKNGRWQVCVEFLWEDRKNNETRADHWAYNYSAVVSEADIREVVRQLELLT